MRRQSTGVDNFGDQELALLRYLGSRPPASLREVADEFGEANKLARTTVHTMLERLRKKHAVSRTKKEGVYLYRLASDEEQMLHGVVGAFVERTLGGSLVPFVNYLAQTKSLKPDEVEALGRLVEQMRREEGMTNES